MGFLVSVHGSRCLLLERFLELIGGVPDDKDKYPQASGWPEIPVLSWDIANIGKYGDFRYIYITEYPSILYPQKIRDYPHIA